MRAKQNDPSTAYRWVRPLLWGALAGVAVCLLLLLLMAAVLAAGDIPKPAVTPLAVSAAVAGAAVGGFVSARLRGENGLVCGALCGLILFLAVMAAGFSLLRQVRGGYALLKLALMLAAGAAGGVIGVGRRR